MFRGPSFRDVRAAEGIVNVKGNSVFQYGRMLLFFFYKKKKQYIFYNKIYIVFYKKYLHHSLGFGYCALRSLWVNIFGT